MKPATYNGIEVLTPTQTAEYLETTLNRVMYLILKHELDTIPIEGYVNKSFILWESVQKQKQQ